MTLFSRKDELGGYRPETWAFWRNLAICFCVFSALGHWIEIVYCTFMRLFGIYDPDSLVWGDPWYPFLVYGVGAVVCTILLVPLKNRLIEHRRSLLSAGLQFFVITVLMCMIMELAMGFMLNRPDASGIYPLWDNSQLPLNIFHQAWLVNDVALAAIAMLYVWLVYPLCEKLFAMIPDKVLNLSAVVITVCFIALCIVKFAP